MTSARAFSTTWRGPARAPPPEGATYCSSPGPARAGRRRSWWLPLPPAECFDLVVATNILVCYDTSEQCLALANVARMTAVGGLFLSNTAVLELPGSTLRSVGYRTVVFSDQPDDGKHVIFYRRLPDPPQR
jgi:hypothetical protein